MKTICDQYRGALLACILAGATGCSTIQFGKGPMADSAEKAGYSVVQEESDDSQTEKKSDISLLGWKPPIVVGNQFDTPIPAADPVAESNIVTADFSQEDSKVEATVWKPASHAVSAPPATAQKPPVELPPLPDEIKLVPIPPIEVVSGVQEPVEAKTVADVTPVSNDCLPEMSKWKAHFDLENSRIDGRVNALEAELSASRELIEELKQTLADSKAEMQQLQSELASWKQELKGLEKTIEMQHEQDIAVLDELSSQLQIILTTKPGQK